MKMHPATRLPLLLLLLLPLAAAHMSMANPPALRYKTNPYAVTQDYDYNSPLSSSGSNYPCKGYHTDLGTPGGQSVASYSPGGSYEITLEGSATHAGGSCQISLSYDGGSSWNVIKSFIGGCVHAEPGSSQVFGFRVPEGAQRGEALLAWSWMNNLGNREFYMNCAVVTIGGGRKRRSEEVEEGGKGTEMEERGLEKRAGGTQIFLANLGNGCQTVGGADVRFPDPGQEVEYGGTGNTALPVGDCGEVKGGGGGGIGASCDYWESLGYICSGASSSRGKTGLLIGLIAGISAALITV